LNSPKVVSKKWGYRYDIGRNNKTLSILCHGVYATKGFRRCGEAENDGQLQDIIDNHIIFGTFNA
jgi:hypothetical protein